MIGSDRSSGWPSLFLGKVMYFGLEAAYRHRQLGGVLEPGQVVGKMLDGWAKLIDKECMTFDSAADEQAMRQQGCDLVTAYLASVPQDERPLAVEVALEAPLVDPDTGENLGMPLVGVIDLMLDGQTGPLIVDLKTAARSSESTAISHEIQLSCYAWLYARGSYGSAANARIAPEPSPGRRAGSVSFSYPWAVRQVHVSCLLTCTRSIGREI